MIFPTFTLAYTQTPNAGQNRVASAIPVGRELQTEIPGYGLVETVIVPANGTVITTNQALVAGTTYKFKASGTITIDNSGRQADAEYAVPGQNNCSSTPQTDIGVGINDTDNDSQKTPYWGGYTGTHIYEIEYQGQGEPVTLNYHDCNYGDNGGNITVEIFARQVPGAQTYAPNECPFCGNADRANYVGGPINTQSGNYGYQSSEGVPFWWTKR